MISKKNNKQTFGWILERNRNMIGREYSKALECIDPKKANEIMNILEDDIDKKEWFIVEKTENKKVFNIDLEGLTFKESIKELLKYWIKIKIDRSKYSIKLYKKWIFIWEIHKDAYRDWIFFTNNHLYKLIEEQFKWKWFWKLLFELYIKKTQEDNNFILPDVDYTKKVSIISLYKKFWYKITWKISSRWTYIELNKNDYKLISKIKEKLKKWIIENKLPNTIILEKLN